MEQKANSFWETEPLSRLMAKYAVPCAISLLVAALYNRNRDAAHRSIGSAVLLCIASGLVLTALYLIFQEPILTLFGGRVNEQTFHHAKEYFFWITLGVPFYMFGQALNPIIQSDGSPKFAMASTLAGALVNIILDPVSIFVFRWGMIGAAEAIVGAAALLIVEMFPRQLIGIFGAANESAYYTEYAVKCFRVYLCMMILATVNKGTFIYLQSLVWARPSHPLPSPWCVKCCSA